MIKHPAHNRDIGGEDDPPNVTHFKRRIFSEPTGRAESDEQ
jgi:hypothetical protein